MEGTDSELNQEVTLTVIVPITKMSGRFNELKTWITASVDLPLQIVFIHDVQDSLTGVELHELISGCPGAHIQIIEGTYGSPGVARNQGLKLAISPWVAFWDADDLPRPDSVLSSICQSQAETEVIIGNFISRFGEVLLENHHLGQLENVAFNPALWRMTFRSSILKEINFSSCLMGEDQIFLIDLNLSSRNIHFSNEIFYEYFQGHPMQLTMNQKSVNEVSGALSLAKAKLQQNNELRNIFSEIVLLRLFGTTLVRTRGINKLKHLLINLNVLCIPRLASLIKFVSVIINNKRLK